MKTHTIYIKEVDSTNDFLHRYTPSSEEQMTVAWTDFQTSGRGCDTNTWESEAGKNLTFSVLLHPVSVPVANQFILSMANALALRDMLQTFVGEITIKWPNDIYWRDRKLCGTLIEPSLRGGLIKDCVIGTGINVNQTVFVGDAPNPVSLAMILGHEMDREQVLGQVTEALSWYMDQVADVTTWPLLRRRYKDSLYRGVGEHPFRSDADGLFMASIVDVEDDGHLVLRCRVADGQYERRRYLFKEVSFVL